MKRVILLLSLFVLTLVSCNSNLVTIHETVEIVSAENVVSFNGKRYSVINNKLYSLENHRLKEIAFNIEMNGVWDYIHNIYAFENDLIIINSNNLYYVDEDLNVKYKFSDFKTSSIEWVQIGGKLYFLEDDVNCRNLSYFDIENKKKVSILKKVIRETSYMVDGVLFYVDFNYDLYLVNDNMRYMAYRNETKLYIFDYGLITIRIDDENLCINDGNFNVGNKAIFPMIEIHGNDIYFALYDYKCDCIPKYTCLCNFNNVLLYKYNLSTLMLECVTNLPSQSYIINMCPLIYYYDSKIYKENEKILDFNIEMGKEYSIQKLDENNIKKRTYAMIYYDDIFASEI